MDYTTLRPQIDWEVKRRGKKHSIVYYIQKEGLGLRCGQFNLFKGNCRLYSFIDSFLLLLMAANEVVKPMQGTMCVKN